MIRKMLNDIQKIRKMLNDIQKIRKMLNDIQNTFCMLHVKYTMEFDFAGACPIYPPSGTVTQLSAGSVLLIM